MTQKMSDLEYILTLDRHESASAKACLVMDFVLTKHSIAEYAAFFYWLSRELEKGDIEFTNLIFGEFKLNKDRAKTLSAWLKRILA